MIPALNEAATITNVVRNVARYGSVIVVDDGSSDDTGKLAASAGAYVVQHGTNQGYERALNSGFRCASGRDFDFVVTLDADGQHNPALVVRFISELEEGYDLVIGHRDRLQRISETVFARIARHLWGVSDPLCGMKGYRIELYRAAGEFDRTRSVGTELALRSIASGCRFAEVPIRTYERKGKPRFGNSFMANFKIFRAMAHMLLLHVSGRLPMTPRRAP